MRFRKVEKRSWDFILVVFDCIGIVVFCCFLRLRSVGVKLGSSLGDEVGLFMFLVYVKVSF